MPDHAPRGVRMHISRTHTRYGEKVPHAARAEHCTMVIFGATGDLTKRKLFPALYELAVRAFEKDPRLDKLKGYVSDSGEGRWTVAEAIEEDVPAPVITLSLLMRLRSRQEDSFGGKVIAALRNEFGGHAVKGS